MRSFSDYFVPDLICDSVFAIPFDRFYRKGIRFLVFDIDNTLVSYDTPKPTEAIKDLMESLIGMGFQIAFLSNNTPERVERFNESFGFFAVSDAHKPLRRAMGEVLVHFGAGEESVLMIGDQLLTDVLSAHLWQVRAVVVPPVEQRENTFFRFKRFLEKPFRRLYYRREKKKEK